MIGKPHHWHFPTANLFSHYDSWLRPSSNAMICGIVSSKLIHATVSSPDRSLSYWAESPSRALLQQQSCHCRRPFCHGQAPKTRPIQRAKKQRLPENPTNASAVRPATPGGLRQMVAAPGSRQLLSHVPESGGDR
jgi:hypothetical protein